MIDLIYFLLLSLGIAMLLFTLAYYFQTDKLTDVSYALSFLALTVYGLLRHGITGTKMIVAAMVGVWAIRLGGFLLIRIRAKGTAARFDAIRGSALKFGRFWLSRAVVVWVLFIPVAFLCMNAAPVLTGFSLAGLAVWATGFAVESIADLQKYRFSQDTRNKGAWIESGMWSYSRHPNYFGEMLVWIGMYMVVFPSLTTTQTAIALISPVCIVVLLRFVSGVPLLETAADKRWGALEEYRRYKVRTGLLIPLPPKNDA